MQEKDSLKAWTNARVGLNRSGHALKTKEILALKYAHALAKDAVFMPWQVKKTKAELESLDQKIIILSSEAKTREQYLRRPDLGRRLCDKSLEKLIKLSKNKYDIVFI